MQEPYMSSLHWMFEDSVSLDRHIIAKNFISGTVKNNHMVIERRPHQPYVQLFDTETQKRLFTLGET